MLDCVELRNSYILLINVIRFKLHLINFVYFFETADRLCHLNRTRKILAFWSGYDRTNQNSNSPVKSMAKAQPVWDIILTPARDNYAKDGRHDKPELLVDMCLQCSSIRTQ